MTGKAVSTFLSKGITSSASGVSGMLNKINDRNHGDRLTSYQELEAFFELMSDKNPRSLWCFEKQRGGAFMRACFLPSLGIYIARMSKRMFGFDGAHLKREMNRYGVFLAATAKDHNDSIVPFEVALAPVEDYAKWRWFLRMVKEALGDIQNFTAISDCQMGLLSPIQHVFPAAGHRFCLRHIMPNIDRSGIPLVVEKRALICKMVRSDCENDYELYRSRLLQFKPKAIVYLDGLEMQHWVKYQYLGVFKTPTYGKITSNLPEQANNWMGDEIHTTKPLDAFCLYFRKLSELVSKKRQMPKRLSSNNLDTLVPVLLKRRADLTPSSSSCRCTPCLDGSYTVQFIGPTEDDKTVYPWRFVNLPALECTCDDWSGQAFPCVHAVAAAIEKGRPLESLYDASRMSMVHFQATYQFAFQPWPTDVKPHLDTTLYLPVILEEARGQGKRGLKPGPKPTHERKVAKGTT